MKQQNFFQDALKETLGIEGNFSDHKNDPGGKTMYGITEKKAREHGYKGDMKDLQPHVAADIYYVDFWQINNLDLVADVSYNLAKEIFDTGVNMDPAFPAVWLQEGLNLFNRQGRYWPDINEDGDIGRITIAALRSLVVRRGSEGLKVLLGFMNVQQGARYSYLARGNEKFEDFIYGWFLKRVL